MKIKDLEIYIENALRNVKNKKWDIEQGKIFILMKINDIFGEYIKKLDNALDDG